MHSYARVHMSSMKVSSFLGRLISIENHAKAGEDMGLKTDDEEGKELERWEETGLLFSWTNVWG